MTSIGLALKTFTYRGKLSLVAIGMAAEDGRTFYAVSSDFYMDQALETLSIDDIKALPVAEDPIHLDFNDLDTLPLEKIKEGFESFLSETEAPEVWTAYGDHEYPILREVFGYYIRAQTPIGFPEWLNSAYGRWARTGADIATVHDGISSVDSVVPWGLPPQVSRKHHALANAHHLLRVLDKCEEWEATYRRLTDNFEGFYEWYSGHLRRGGIVVPPVTDDDHEVVQRVREVHARVRPLFHRNNGDQTAS